MRDSAPTKFMAFRVDIEDGTAVRGLAEVSRDVLPDNDVLVAVEYSSLNYKDALSATGNRGVTKAYPHTPGIDMAGTVVASRVAGFAPGDEVVCTGYDLGMNTPGGFGEFVSVPGDWLVPLPEGLGPREAMAIGTAGLTAEVALRRVAAAGAMPGLGPLVVTGASGGVGSMAVWLASRAGFDVIASSGTAAAGPLLRALGASEVVGREELAEVTDRPLMRAEFAGGIDTVGGETLANLVKRTRHGGAVAACGLVGGPDLRLTVFPFILRGVALLGVDSQQLSHETRVAAWNELARAWRERGDELEGSVTEVPLAEVDEYVDQILGGNTVGRVVVRVAGERG